MAGARRVELRVHGVGGDAAHRVLGLPYETDVVVVATLRGRAGVYAPRQPGGQCGYVWGPLTSGSSLFALWTLMLPFTLSNVAGWMHPRLDVDAGRTRRTRVAAIRYLVFVDGLVLTAASASWVATLMFGLFGYTRGVVFTPFLVAASVGGALTGSKRFEGYRLEGVEREYHPLHRPIGLTDRGFFAGGRTLLVRWSCHLVVAVAVTVLVLVVARDAQSAAAVGGEWSVWLTTAGLVVAMVAFLLGVECRKGASDWRWGGSGAVSALAHLLVAGVVAAALSVLDESRREELGRSLALLDVFGVALAVGALVAVVTAILVMLRRSPYESIPPPPAERFLGGAAAARRWARVAQLPRHVDLTITAVGLTGIVGAVWVVVFVGRGTESAWRAQSTVWTWLALLVLAPVLGFLVRDVRRNAFSVDRRRRVGQIWDVLAFWPRAFHPLAVRPYGERAVPELIEVLSNRTAVRADEWVVTAHSQGAVIVMASMVSGAPGNPYVTHPAIRVITFGSPLRHLHAKAFPHYVGDHVFDVFGSRLGEGGWRNVWRATDPVGREMYADALDPRDGHVDVNLPQPNTRPPSPDASATDLEQDTPSGAIDVHSGYRRTRTLRTEVRRPRQP